MKTGAVAIVRSAVDLAPLTALHHVLIGADTVWVIDNGSSDGTYEALRDLAAKVPGLRVDRDDGPFDQARMATDMANALLREGHRLIVPSGRWIPATRTARCRKSGIPSCSSSSRARRLPLRPQACPSPSARVRM